MNTICLQDVAVRLQRGNAQCLEDAPLKPLELLQNVQICHTSREMIEGARVA